MAIRECLNHEGIFGALVSHGSSTVPEYIVNEINGLGGTLTGAYGIAIHELQAAGQDAVSTRLMWIRTSGWLLPAI